MAPPQIKLPPHLPRKRGGQPGNQNARKLDAFSVHRPGPLSPIRAEIKALNQLHYSDTLSPHVFREQAHGLIRELGLIDPNSMTIVPLEWQAQLLGLIARAAASTIPAVRRRRALQTIARAPLLFFQRECKDSGITRDADSFFPVSKLSARNSPLPPALPSLATDLTDKQWAVLAPLVPPDPREDWLSGRPPTIIAANRWGFSPYRPGSELDDFAILQEHDRILQRFPALTAPPAHASPAKKRGRPRKAAIPARAVLDAIFWKLATGRTWNDLPKGFPPARLCRNYYRRLFLSGRLFTLLLALYNHMRLETDTDLSLLVDAGIFDTTRGQKITLAPGVPTTQQNYTALLFMQLARSTYSRLQRESKQRNPLYPLLPDFKGDAPLSTGLLSPAIRYYPPRELQTDLPYRKMKSGI